MASDLRRDQPVPLYYQVDILLRRDIEAGHFSDGRLPTEGDLSKRFNVSRITVRSALRRLEEDGLIERHRARGTFVRRDASTKIERAPERLLGFEADLRRQGISPDIEVLAFELIEPPVAVARGLEVEPGTLVYRLRRLGRAAGQPLWLESRYFPRHVGQRMQSQELSAASITVVLQDVLNVQVAAAHLRLEANAADGLQARHLGIRRGQPLLVNQCTFFDSAGHPLELLRATFRGDRYALTFDLPTHPNVDGALDEETGQTWPALISQTATTSSLHHRVGRSRTQETR